MDLFRHFDRFHKKACSRSDEVLRRSQQDGGVPEQSLTCFLQDDLCGRHGQLSTMTKAFFVFLLKAGTKQMGQVQPSAIDAEGFALSPRFGAGPNPVAQYSMTYP